MKRVYIIVFSFGSLCAHAQNATQKKAVAKQAQVPVVSTFAQNVEKKVDKQKVPEINLAAMPNGNTASMRQDQKPFDATPGVTNNGANVNIYSTESKVGNSNTKLKNEYIYDDQGRMIQSKSSFEFGKK